MATLAGFWPATPLRRRLPGIEVWSVLGGHVDEKDLEVADVRWRQRFQHFASALGLLQQATDLAATRGLSELEQEGLIQRFEYTYELAWKVLKDFLQDAGYVELKGARDVTRQAFRIGFLADEQVWIDMVNARNLTSHTYDQETVAGIAEAILLRFAPAFVDLCDRLRREP